MQTSGLVHLLLKATLSPDLDNPEKHGITQFSALPDSAAHEQQQLLWSILVVMCEKSTNCCREVMRLRFMESLLLYIDVPRSSVQVLSILSRTSELFWKLARYLRRGFSLELDVLAPRGCAVVLVLRWSEFSPFPPLLHIYFPYRLFAFTGGNMGNGRNSLARTELKVGEHPLRMQIVIWFQVLKLDVPCSRHRATYE